MAIHRVITIFLVQYYLAFNSDWLFACYCVIIFSLVATAAVTRRLILMKVKVCYARVRVISTFSTSESTNTKTRLFTARAYARAVLVVVILSVRLSVTRVYCDKTK